MCGQVKGRLEIPSPWPFSFDPIADRNQKKANQKDLTRVELPVNLFVEISLSKAHPKLPVKILFFFYCVRHTGEGLTTIVKRGPEIFIVVLVVI